MFKYIIGIFYVNRAYYLTFFENNCLISGARNSNISMFSFISSSERNGSRSSSGGLTIVPELHKGLILLSMQKHLRPIVNPVVTRKISLVIRKDYIHEKMLNIVIDALKSVIPFENQDEMIRKGRIKI